MRRKLAVASLVLVGAACALAIEESIRTSEDEIPGSPSASASSRPPGTARVEADATTGSTPPCDRSPRIVTVPRDAGPDAEDGGDAGTMEIVVYEDCVRVPPKDLGDPPPGKR